MKNLYRIYTEDIGRDNIVYVCGAHYDAYTLISADGYWGSKKEESLIIEIIAPSTDYGEIQRIARWIKTTNKQQAVLITVSPVESELV